MLHTIQNEIKAPKGQFNKFGNYKYRSCEDIVEAAKPVLNKHGFSLTLSDDIVNIGGRFYVKATATIQKGEIVFSASAFAREEETKKGMDGAQITGSASSYARKYALNGLFAIDDTKDSDATNTHGQLTGKQVEEEMLNDVVDEGDRKLLVNLVYTSDMTDEEKVLALEHVNNCQDYTLYQKLQHRLEERQPSFNQIVNPSATDAKKAVRKIVKQPAA